MTRPPRKNGPPGRQPGGKPPGKPHGKQRQHRDRDEDDDDDGAGQCDSARLKLRRLDGNCYSFTPPVCAFDRKEDIEEVQQMITAGELEIARDELLYLVSDCRAFLEAHNLLGELALEEEDISLARGHFGFAYEIGLDSLPAGFRGTLPAKRDYNRAFFLAGRGLARCLIARGQTKEGRAVLAQLAKFDPQEEHVKSLLKELDARDAKN